MAIEEKDIAKYGQLQAIIQDDEVKSPAARQLARSKLRGIRETISLNAPMSIRSVPEMRSCWAR